MSAIVPHYRPDLEDGSIRAGEPVGSLDWSTLAAGTNWLMGHGSVLVPWCALGLTVSSGNSATFPFRIKPKAQAVERIWCVNLRASGATAPAVTITVDGSTSRTVYPSSARNLRADSFALRHPLSAKSTTEAETTLKIETSGGGVVVESCSCYEQTRGVLASDTTDYGVDVTSLRPRQPIADLANQSIAGVCDAYKNLDARRNGLFDWSTPEASAISPGSTSATDLFALYPVIHAAIPTAGDTTATVTVAVKAKVTGGTGTVTFSSSDAGDSVSLSITATSFGWVTDTLEISAEDLSIADGRRGNAWETVRIQAQDPAGQTLSIAAISIFRSTTPL